MAARNLKRGSGMSGGATGREPPISGRVIVTCADRSEVSAQAGGSACAFSQRHQGVDRLFDPRGLANRLHRHGIALQAGEVVLAGSFIRPIDVARGDTIVADYGEFGTVACHFG